MVNQSFASWCMEQKNMENNLKIVMWNGVKMPVSNLMCPVCNPKKLLKQLKAVQERDPECSDEETQALIHELHGWNNCALAIHSNKVYHAECLEKKLGKSRFKKLQKKGEILVEAPKPIKPIDAIDVSKQ